MMGNNRNVLPSKVGAAIAGISVELLTFGLEFEFILIDGSGDLLSGRRFTPGEAVVREVLMEDGRVPAFNREETLERMPGRPMNPTTMANSECYSKWTVETDGSIGLIGEEDGHLPQGSIHWAVELKTRTFSVLEDDWMGEITQVLLLLYSKLDGRILVNDSCGMHVHIGRKATATSPACFDVRTIKSLFQLVTAFEHQIEELHTGDRIGSSDRELANFCQPLSQGFQEYQDFGTPGYSDYCFVLSAVQYAETTSFEDHRGLLVARIEDPKFTNFDLLKAIRALNQVASYYGDAPMLAKMELAKLTTRTRERHEADVGLQASSEELIKATMAGEADKEAQLQDLFGLVSYQRLIRSAFRRRAIAGKLERGDYGNFDYRLKSKLLAAVVRNELAPVVEYEISEVVSD